MKTVIRSQVFRVIVALSMLMSSALVVEAGQRWK
jgi:hypothetical protein